ncbi:MAG: hypothetical protein ACLU38_08750 [Dysosmobacter sp.]
MATASSPSGTSTIPTGAATTALWYRFTTEDHTCEGDIKLVSVSDETFIDNGHAMAWAMSKAN